MATAFSSGGLTVDALRSVALFSDCSDAELDGVISLSAVLRHDAGSVLVAEGDPGTDAFVILSGKAAVSRHGDEVAVLGPGEIFGEMAAVSAGVRTATVTAATPVELLLIDPPGLAEVLGRSTVAWKALQTLAERLRVAQDLPDWGQAVAGHLVAYTLGAEEPELRRLLTQAEVWAPMADWLLDQVEVPVGGRAIDVACGPLGIMHLLADRLGPGGEVFGLDREPRMLALAREVAAERGLSLNLVEGDAASTDLPRGSFDLVHARTLLINVVNPEEIVAEMAGIARPGGTIALQEPDGSYWECDPPHPAWDRLHAALRTAYRQQGRDFSVGRRLGRILRGAGLQEVHSHAHVFRTETGDAYQTLLLAIVDAARPLILDGGVYDERSLDELSAVVRAHLEQPDTTTAFAFWQAWARRGA
jgi:SAM-dependent methyltransferase